MSVEVTPHGGIGESIKRREDARFLRGRGNYLDDIVLPGMLHMAIVRSPHAHARIRGVDTAEAADVSTPVMRACACGLRTIAMCSMPGRTMSSR